MARYGQFGGIAVEVVGNFLSSANAGSSPSDEWDSVSKKNGSSFSALNNDSPKRVFLSLCENGLVKGISPGRYTESVHNKRYALEAVHLLKNDSALANIATPAKLWKKVLASLGIDNKKHQQQMNVVLELWDRGYIQ